jgi:hypothetical protein
MGTEGAPENVKHGDTIDIEITGIGTLSNPVVREGQQLAGRPRDGHPLAAATPARRSADVDLDWISRCGRLTRQGSGAVFSSWRCSRSLCPVLGKGNGKLLAPPTGVTPAEPQPIHKIPAIACVS